MDFRNPKFLDEKIYGHHFYVSDSRSNRFVLSSQYVKNNGYSSFHQLNKRAEIGTVWDIFNDNKYVFEEIFSIEIDLALQYAMDSDRNNPAIIVHGHPPATFFDPEQADVMIMYTPNAEISFNSSWRMLNRGIEDSHLHELNQSKSTDITIQLTEGPDIIIISGNRANKFIKMGSREFSSNSRIFTILGKAMPWEDQKLKKQVYNDQRDKTQARRYNQLQQNNKNEAEKLIFSAKQTFVRRPRNSPNSNRYGRSPNDNDRRNYQSWRPCIKNENYRPPHSQSNHIILLITIIIIMIVVHLIIIMIMNKFYMLYLITFYKNLSIYVLTNIILRYFYFFNSNYLRHMLFIFFIPLICFVIIRNQIHLRYMLTILFQLYFLYYFEFVLFYTKSFLLLFYFEIFSVFILIHLYNY